MDPIEVYLGYKNSTKQFTEWLLKTSTLKGMVNTVDSWPAHANNIVANVANLRKHESFMTELTRVLYHGNNVIEKRKEEHLHKQQKMKFNSEEEKNNFEKDNEGHAHIIVVLQECYDVLKVLAPPAEERTDIERPANRQQGRDFTSPNLESVERCTEGISSINIGDNEAVQLEDIEFHLAIFVAVFSISFWL
jgi:hypothetical protein